MIEGFSGSLKILVGKVTWDPGNLADGANASTTVKAPGARKGMPAVAAHDKATSGAGQIWSAVVSSDDTVTVTLQNETGGALDIASGTLKAIVFDF